MKTTTEQIEKGQGLLQTLVTKAWESATFKEQLISDPEAAIKEVTGQSNFSSDTKLVVEDQTDSTTIYLNIPRKIDVNDFELTDEQLEVVSGGETVVLGVAALFVAAFSAGVAVYAATH